jgi:betaine-aldehyde dehydrogenase
VIKQLYIDGRWRDGENGTFDSINPADGSVAVRVAHAGAADVDEAVAAARRALADPSWARLRPPERAGLLHAMARLTREHEDRLARAQMADNGKTYVECLSQARVAASVFQYYAAVCETFEGEVTPARGNYMSLSVYEPVGVVAAITPWNSPLTLEAQKMAPILAAGNTMVLKPSEITPAVALEYARLTELAGFPKGVFNVVEGFGETVGQALAEHPGIDMITFTGGTDTGRILAEIAGRRLIPCTMELGGKSPNIVFADADPDKAVRGAAYGIFSSGGQSCVAGSRIFVEDAIYDDFMAGLVAAAKALRIGMPEDEETQIAPMASFQHRDKVEQQVSAAASAGAQIRCGGSRPKEPRLDQGAFYVPTVIDGVDNSAEIAQREVFGPVATVLRFNNEKDLIEQANDTIYGLASGIWTRDGAKALRIAREIRAGAVWINTYKQTSIATPFGGFKQSGLAREKGIQGMRVYMEQKGIFISLEE